MSADRDLRWMQSPFIALPSATGVRKWDLAVYSNRIGSLPAERLPREGPVTLQETEREINAVSTKNSKQNEGTLCQEWVLLEWRGLRQILDTPTNKLRALSLQTNYTD
jgi:hypothetical protein